MTSPRRLPLVKVIWGAFALPWMYRDQWFRAAAVPLLAVIALSLLWSVFEDPTEKFELALWYVGWLAATSWLAVHIHRVVLLDPEKLTTTPARAVRSVGVYFATIVFLWVIWFVIVSVLAIAATTAVLLIAHGVGHVSGVHGLPPPPFDPEIQAWIDRVTLLARFPAAYLVARLSLLLPAVALERDWRPRAAWNLSAGNGWRLAIVVVLLPEVFNSFGEWVTRDNAAPLETGVLAVLMALLASLAVIALSLSFQELERHEPPPTDPPG